MNGILLAGGQSARMGTDKRWLPWRGLPLWEFVLRRLQAFCDKVIVVVEDAQKFSALSAEPRVYVAQDIFPGKKALGGIYTGLKHSCAALNFVAACDMPFIHAGLARYLESLAGGYDWVLPQVQSRLQPLCSVLAASSLPTVEKALLAGELKVQDLRDRLRTRIVTDAEIAPLDPDGQTFLNINTPEDFQRASTLSQKRMT